MLLFNVISMSTLTRTFILFSGAKYVKEWTTYIEQTCPQNKSLFDISYVVKKFKTVESLAYIYSSYVKRMSDNQPIILINECRNIVIKWNMIINILDYIKNKDLVYDVISLENQNCETSYTDHKNLRYQYDKIIDQTTAILINSSKFHLFMELYNKDEMTSKLRWYCLAQPAVIVLPSVKNIVGVNALWLDATATDEIKPLHTRSGTIVHNKHSKKFKTVHNAIKAPTTEPEIKQYMVLIKITMDEYIDLIGSITEPFSDKTIHSKIEELMSATMVFNSPNYCFYFYCCNPELSTPYVVNESDHTIQIKATNDFLDQTYLLYTALTVVVQRFDCDGVIKINYVNATSLINQLNDLDNDYRRTLYGKLLPTPMVNNTSIIKDKRTPHNSVLKKFPIYTPLIKTINPNFYVLSITSVNKLVGNKHYVLPYSEITMASYVRTNKEKNITLIFNPFFIEEFFVSYVLQTEINMVLK